MNDKDIIEGQRNKIVVGSHWPTSDPNWKEWGWKYSFTTNAPIPKEKWLELIPAIEAVLNSQSNK